MSSFTNTIPLVLAWAITINKCQGLTLPEIVVVMTPGKGHYTVGQAYVAFSRVTQLDKLHVINYTRKQIHVYSMQKRRWRGYAKIPYSQCQNVFLT